MITKSGYKHTRSFKGHRDVINCFVYNEEYLYTASNDGRILQWSLQDEGADKPVKQFGRLLEAYYTEKERKWDFTDSGDEEERITLFKTTPGVSFKEANLEKLTAERKKLFPFHSDFAKDHDVVESRKDQKDKHTQGVCCLALNGKYLYSGSFDTTTIKWDTTANDPYVGTFKGHTQAVYSVACLDVWLLTASRDKTVRVWNEATRKQTAILGGGDAETGHSAPIRTMALQDRLLYTGSDDKTIRQWEWRAGAMVRVYRGHKDGVTDLKLLDKFLFSSSFDMTVRTWSVDNGSCVRICQAEAGLRGLEVAAGKIFGAGNNAVLYIWDLSTNSSEWLAADRLARGGLTMVAVEGNKVFCSSSDNACRIWLKSSTPGGKRPGGTEEGATVVEEGVADRTRYESDDEREGDAEEETQRARDLVSMRGMGAGAGESGGPTLNNKYLDHVPEGVHGVCVHRGFLYSGGSDNMVRVRPINPNDKAKWGGTPDDEGMPQPLAGQHTDRVLAVTVAGDGEFLFSASADSTIVKWNAMTGAYLATLTGHTDWVSCLTEGQGNLFSGGWDNTVRKWDVSADKFIAEFLGHQDPVCCLAVVGEVLLSGSRDCTVRAWKIDTGECIKVYEGHNALVSSVIAADPLMYTASWDKTIRCWELATGKVKGSQYKRLDKPVLCLALSHGILYAGGGDQVVRSYIASTMEAVHEMDGHTQPVNALALTDHQLFSASDDGSVVQWLLPDASAQRQDDDMPDPALSRSLTQRILEHPQTGNPRTSSISNRLNSEAQYLAQVDAEDPVPSRKEGWLMKQGQLFKRWSRRYFTLHKGVMVVFSDESQSKPLEHIIMHDVIKATLLDAPAPNGTLFPFTLETIDRVRKLAAFSDKDKDKNGEQEAKEWVGALNTYVENNNLQKKIEQKRAARKY